MKLSALKTENEVIDILHPELGDVGIKFTVCSPMTKEFANKTARSTYKDAESPLTGWVVGQSLAAILDWSGIEDDEGNAIGFTQEKAEELLTDPAYYWMAAGIDEHFGKKKGYLQLLTNRLKLM